MVGDRRYATMLAAWSSKHSHADTDYSLVARVGTAYAGHSRSGRPALVIPLSDAIGVGRRAAGLELAPHRSLLYRFDGAEWIAPAAVLMCADPEVVESFAVLAADVARRAELDQSWQAILSAVEEWQTLLAPRGRPTAESELGLWGELWFLNQAEDVDRALGCWRGPDRDSSDFFLEGVAAEVKTSRVRRQHHISLAQVDDAKTFFPSWLVSIWVKLDPGSSQTVPLLAAQIVARSSDPAEAMRHIARGGYNANDRREYSGAFALAAEPEWYSIADVPRVKAADPGVSHIRYRVILDETRRAPPAEVAKLRQHFHGSKNGDT